LAHAVGSGLALVISLPPRLPVASLRSPLSSTSGTGGHELPGQCPRGKPRQEWTLQSRPLLPATDDDIDSARPRFPPCGVPRMRLAVPHRPPVLAGTVPSRVPFETVASSDVARRTPGGRAPCLGATRVISWHKLATQCRLSLVAETAWQRHSSRQPDPSAATACLENRATRAGSHPMPKAVSSYSLAGVWLERPLHLILVSWNRCLELGSVFPHGDGLVEQVHSARRGGHSVWRAKTRVHQMEGPASAI
jgi:hypothetical protein